jgi:chemotaxis signal transduction protein
MQKLVLFQIGNRQFGLDMSLVTYIQQGRPVLAAQPESGNPDGLIIDGKTIPFYNLPDLFGPNSDTKEPTGQKIVMVKDQRQTFAFLVNRVEGMIDADENQIDRLPSVFKGPASACFPRVLRMEDSLILLMDPKGIGRIKSFIESLNADDIAESEPFLLKDIPPTTDSSVGEAQSLGKNPKFDDNEVEGKKAEVEMIVDEASSHPLWPDTEPRGTEDPGFSQGMAPAENQVAESAFAAEEITSEPTIGAVADMKLEQKND